MSSGKKGTHTFLEQTLRQKNMGSKKKELILFRAKHSAKKTILSAKQVWVPK